MMMMHNFALKFTQRIKFDYVYKSPFRIRYYPRGRHSSGNCISKQRDYSVKDGYRPSDKSETAQWSSLRY